MCTDCADVADHYCFRNENPGVHASHSSIKDSLVWKKGEGVAFSLLTIMPQALPLFLLEYILL